jgi:transcription antitermination factor NusG
LYPGYVFVAVASLAALHPLATVLTDVVGLLRDRDGKVATSPLLDRKVTELKASEDAHGYVPPPAHAIAPVYARGVILQVRAGPLAGQVGKVSNPDDGGGGVVLDLEMFGRVMPLAYRPDQLAAAT